MPRNGKNGNGKNGNGKKIYSNETKELARARVTAGESLSRVARAGAKREKGAMKIWVKQ